MSFVANSPLRLLMFSVERTCFKEWLVSVNKCDCFAIWPHLKKMYTGNLKSC